MFDDSETLELVKTHINSDDTEDDASKFEVITAPKRRILLEYVPYISFKSYKTFLENITARKIEDVTWAKKNKSNSKLDEKRFFKCSECS